MEDAWIYTAGICLDFVVCSALHYGAALALSPSNNPRSLASLAQLWILAGLRWALVRLLCTLLLKAESKAVFHRCIAAICLLCPVYESGLLVLLGKYPENWSGSLSSPWKMLLTTAATATACLFWEVNVPERSGKKCPSSNGEKKHKEKAMFMRVIRYSKPDALFLGGAFLFLALAVICEMFIPYYTGKVIDILGSYYQPSSFMEAIFYMGLFSVGSVINYSADGVRRDIDSSPAWAHCSFT
ncbi:hypothetical protein JZ751_010692 [Albula glossodonta]|uniref:Uncharacterized protein n=1 Tax=Albula glossodonta TaxID=121402 RepID=A0A8T2N7M5_9TELE|nr:hypothetical protein JZ751_010692 [Albula glossodonta]